MKIIRGLAIPYERPRFVESEGAVEVIAQKAFNEFVASQQQIPVRWPFHGGPQVGRTTALFAGKSGLFFECAIDDSSRRDGMLAAIVHGRTAGCSVNFTEREVEIDDNEHERVIAAAIDHIAITDNAAHPRTLCWRADDGANLALAPDRVRMLDAEFETYLTLAQWETAREAPPRSRESARIAAAARDRRARAQRERHTALLALLSPEGRAREAAIWGPETESPDTFQQPLASIAIAGIIDRAMEARVRPQIAAFKGRELTLTFDTPGGRAYSGQRIADDLRALKARGVKVKCVAVGGCHSAALNIFLQGDRRIAHPDASFTLHRAVAPHALTAKSTIAPELAKKAAEYERCDQVVLAEFRKARVTLSPWMIAQFKAGHDVLLTAAKAKWVGLAHDVVEGGAL